MRLTIFLVILTLMVSCDREKEFDAILAQGPAPTEVQANITFNNEEPPFSVTVSPTAQGATAFEVISGLPGAETLLVGIQQSLTFEYPEAEENFFVTIRAIAANGLVTELQFEVVPPADPCTQIFSAPVTWDPGNEPAFQFGFNGAEVEVVENPDPSGANPEVSNVLQITQDGGGNFDGFGVQMTSPTNFAAEDKVVRLLFWSDVEVPIRLTVQQDPNNQTEREAEVNLIHTGSGWEEMRFDFATATAGFTNEGSALGIDNFVPFVPTGDYIRFQMFISPGDDVAGTFFLDNVGICPEGGTAPPDTPAGPVAPSNVQADIQISGDMAPFSVTITPTADDATSFEILSGIPGDDMAVAVPLGGSAMFDYPDTNPSYMATVRALGEEDTVTEAQFEVVLPTGDPMACTPLFAPLTMENGETFGQFNLAGDPTIVPNPDVSGANAVASNVLEVIGGGMDFQAVQYFPAEPIDFGGTEQTITMLVWSQQAVNFRVNPTQGVAGALDVEVTAGHGGTGWEELTFDFSNATLSFNGQANQGDPFVPTGQYNELQIFIAVQASSSETFYIDNITGGCE